MRQRELAATAKAFMLDRPEVSLQELTEHLRSMAEQFLTDASDDYWNGLEVATLVDEKSNLKELAATQALSLDQQKGIRLALEVLTAAQQRVDTGDTSGLIKLIDDNNLTDDSTIGDSTSILNNEQGDRPAVFTQERQSSVVFSSLVSSLLAEKVQTLKTSSYKDLSSSLNTVSRFLPEDMDLMSRSGWLAVVARRNFSHRNALNYAPQQPSENPLLRTVQIKTPRIPEGKELAEKEAGEPILGDVE